MTITIDTRERYPYRFAGRPVQCERQALRVGDYAVLAGDALIAVVERKTLEDFTKALVDGALNYALADLATVPAAAVVVEERYGALLKDERVQPGWLLELVARLQVRYPAVPIVFADSRKLAEEWTYRFLAAALVHHAPPVATRAGDATARRSRRRRRAAALSRRPPTPVAPGGGARNSRASGAVTGGMRTLLLSTVALALLAAAPTANAAGWSRPFSHQAGKGAFVEPVPRVAVAPDGMSVASFAQRGYIYAVTGDARGRFGRLQRLGRWASIASVVAAGRDGAALVAWEARDGLRVAVRRRTGRRLTTRRLATSSNSAINDLAVQVDPRGGWFLLESEFSQKTRKNRVRAFTLRADGTPALAPQSLGQGSFGAEARPVRALAVDDRGYATAVFGTPDGVVAAQGVHQGHFGPLAPFGDRSITDPRVTASRDADGRPLVAATRIANCGDAGCFGQPRGGAAGPHRATAAVRGAGARASRAGVRALDRAAGLRRGRARLLAEVRPGRVQPPGARQGGRGARRRGPRRAADAHAEGRRRADRRDAEP